ncbi:hypothetical protein [Rhodopila sp.]|jgi:hypothetical protein|uniref:hypothetical protein n=1 Tax=Rhodopila sp. TaxID=2480087 RepID=UPI002CC3BAB8|nr:hypothetical protein [Rhodopila sp.]HVZ08468.1 hypothetical protein [Rhodopila sp.]
MGQIIRLPAHPAAYPDTCTRLDTAECVALLAMRWWVAAFRQNEDPLPRISGGLERAGAGRAALSVDALMSIVARSARRSLMIHRPRCPHLGTDETHLLHAAALVQQGDRHLAEKALHIALLSAQGAEFALGPLDGLGHLFAQARLFFRRRLPPDTTVHDEEGWSSNLYSDMVH